MTDTSIFNQEYDLDALTLLTPRGQNFSMYVTPRYIEHYKNSYYEPLSTALFTSLLHNTSLFLDVGASYGFFSLLSGAHNNDLNIIAVEPTPQTCTALKKSAKLSKNKNIKIFEAAVSDKIGKRHFNVTRASDSCGFFDHPNIDTIDTIEVETTTVDHILKDYKPCPLVIKIDTEGNELAVLQGMTETLARFEDINLLIEYCPKNLISANIEPTQFIAYLNEIGFDAFIIDEFNKKFYRLTSEHSNLDIIKSNYANLFCIRKSKSMNILFFSHSAQFGGSERVLVELVEDLIKDHKCICTVALPKEGPVQYELEKLGAATIIIPYKWWVLHKVDKYNHEAEAITRKSIKAINKYLLPHLKAMDPDIIWTQSIVVPWGAMIAHKIRKPHIWYITEYGFKDHGMIFFDTFDIITNQIKEAANLIYTCSLGVLQELFNKNENDKIKTLYCHPKLTVNEKNKNYFTNNASLKLGIFGFVSLNKNQEDLVRAIALAQKKNLKVELILVGKINPDYKLSLDDIIAQNNISSSINFIGELSDPFVAMNECDIVITCSKFEAFGRTPLEAMMLGKPVICPNLGGSTEYVIDQKNGFYYTPGNPEELLNCIEKFILNPSLMKEFGENGKKHAMMIFNKSNFGDKVFTELKNILRTENNLIKIPYSINNYIEDDNIHINLKSQFSFHKKRIRIRNQSEIEYKFEQFFSEMRYFKNNIIWHLCRLMNKIFK